MSVKKMIILCLITLLMFFATFILIANDYMNMVPVTFTITVLLFIYLIIKTFTKNDKKSVYQRELKNILKTNDSILIYSKGKFDAKDSYVLRVKTIDDLLKAQQIINKPIIYFSGETFSKFALKDDERLLVYTLNM